MAESTAEGVCAVKILHNILKTILYSFDPWLAQENVTTLATDSKIG